MKRLFTAALFVVSTLLFLSLSVSAQVSEGRLLQEIEAKRAELGALEKAFLAPAESDREAYAEFLRQPDTGLIRLLPREVYDSEAYKKNRRTLTIRGGGAYYSFTRLTHEYGYGSDISLDSNYLSVGFAGVDYGMFFKLGDVPLETVTLEYPGAQFISTYNPPTFEPELRLEQRRFGNGAIIDEGLYKSRLPVELNTTLLLRSISYERADVLVALRIVRQDLDGSVIVVWKLLKKYHSPALAPNS